jgi:pimeloyl-ACP methyl ester carboxylesterase
MPTVSLGDGSLFYERRGSGPPIAFVHGGWQDSNAWEPQTEDFSDEYSVITYDIRGHGQTGATTASEYSIDLFADDLETLLVELDVENPILVGMSVGGMITRTFLERHPDWVRGAVIGGPFQSMPSLDFVTDLNPFLSPVQAVSQMVATLGSAGTFRALLNSMAAANGGSWLSLDSAVRDQAITAARAVDRAEYTKIFEALYTADPADISHVETPLLVLYGGHETGQIKRQGRQLAESVPNGQHREIADAAHLVNQDNPTAFNKACAEFFETLGE